MPGVASKCFVCAVMCVTPQWPGGLGADIHSKKVNANAISNTAAIATNSTLTAS
jgi:hypothetical protein